MSLPQFSTPALPGTAHQDADHRLAAKHQPLLLLDALEPALPLAFGYSLYRQAGPSASSKFHLSPPDGGVVIEYAVWYDWDIEHLYDLEHVWVHLDATGDLVRVEGSMHGLRVAMDAGSGMSEVRDGRPVLYVEPGKHALWAVDKPMQFMARAMITRACGPDAGSQGIHIGNMFAANEGYTATPLTHQLASRIMARAAFEPSFDFSRSSDEMPPALMPWAVLAAWIPERMRRIIATLEQVDQEQAAEFGHAPTKEVRQ